MSKPDRADQQPAAVSWLADPEDHDYPAAAAYLSLLAPTAQVEALMTAFQKAPTTTQKAKDILRASALPLLDPSNAHVAGDLRKITDGKDLSPVLVVRGDLLAGRHAVIADGYHRVCASYHTDENTDIPLRLVDPPS